MDKITNFAIFKETQKKSQKSPDYQLSTKNGEVYINIGSGWIKEGKKGKFISVQLKSAYNGVGGFYIAQESSTSLTPDEAQKIREIKEMANKKETIVESEINPLDIPF